MPKLEPVISIELAEDMKHLLKHNTDVVITDTLQQQIIDSDNDDLLKITKEFGSFKITAVELVTEELLDKEL